MLGRRPQRIAEAHELVQSGDHAVFDVEIDDRLVLGQPQIAQRIDKKGGASTDFIPQQGDTCAGVVVGFDNHILEFVSKVLFDGDFVLFFNLGIVREHADRVEILAASSFVGGEKFLHRIGGVGTVVQDLRERRVARTNSGERVAQNISLLRSSSRVAASVQRCASAKWPHSDSAH